MLTHTSRAIILSSLNGNSRLLLFSSSFLLQETASLPSPSSHPCIYSLHTLPLLFLTVPEYTGSVNCAQSTVSPAIFMQSVPTGVSHQATLSQDQPQPASASTQHGSLHDDDHLSGAILLGDAPDEHGRAASVGDASSDVSSPTLSHRSLRSLSSQRSRNSTSPVDRISLYESASSPSPRRASEFGFKVIPSKNKGSDGLSIDIFPNGTSL